MHPELNQKWQKIEQIRQEYLLRLLQSSPQQLSYQPPNGGWNMLQVVRHLQTSEHLSIAYLISKNYANARKGGGIQAFLRGLSLRLMLLSPLKFKAPSIPGLQPDPEQDVESLLANWEEDRKKLYTYLENFPPEKIHYLLYRHPRAGWLNILQTLNFLEDHMRHHQHQFARIQKSEGFPA